MKETHFDFNISYGTETDASSVVDLTIEEDSSSDDGSLYETPLDLTMPKQNNLNDLTMQMEIGMRLKYYLVLFLFQMTNSNGLSFRWQ